jgi:hypothetical protein
MNVAIRDNKINNKIINLIRCNELEKIENIFNQSKEKIDIHYKNDTFFIEACMINNLKIMKLLWNISNHTINIHYNMSYPLRIACNNNNLIIAKWLWSISKNKIEKNVAEEIFGITCKLNYLEIMMWIWNISKINVECFNNHVLRILCENKNYKMIKWLWFASNRSIQHHLIGVHKEIIKNNIYNDRKIIINYRKNTRIKKLK